MLFQINIIQTTDLRINNKSIKIWNKIYPKINKKDDFSKCELRDIDEDEYRNFKLYFINKYFAIKKEEIDKNKNDTFNFSTYLISDNYIIDKSISDYDYAIPNKYSKVYGFSDEKFDSFSFNDKNLKVALSLDTYSSIKFKNIFNSNEIVDFKSNAINFKSEISSNEIEDINEALSNLIKQNINIEDESSIKNLKASNKSKTSINNILIFLLKYSFNFRTSNELKEQLFNIFSKIFKCAKGRKIEKYFDIPIQFQKYKIFLEKLSYIISFILLCISPGELLEYEYLENNENCHSNINEIYSKNFLNQMQLNLKVKYHQMK